jgi:hypothetical protein
MRGRLCMAEPGLGKVDKSDEMYTSELSEVALLHDR